MCFISFLECYISYPSHCSQKPTAESYPEHTSPAHNFTIYFSKVYLNTVLPSLSRSPTLFSFRVFQLIFCIHLMVPLKFSNKSFVCISWFPNTMCLTHFIFLDLFTLKYTNWEVPHHAVSSVPIVLSL